MAWAAGTALVFLCALASCAAVSASSAGAESAQTGASQGPLLCWVVRTYWGHGDQYGDGSLSRLLKSFTLQTEERWEALLLVYDSRPFMDLRSLVRKLEEPERISVFAEVVGHTIKPKDEKGNWVQDYHNNLYNLTDDAIRACPRGSEWVVVTNGDNLYDIEFAEHLAQAPEDADVVAFDFYSRYQRPTANPCDRLRQEEGAPMCKQNLMQFCQTDLAASAYRVRKLLEEDRRFGAVDTGSSGANDGIMASLVTGDGWKVHRVRRCLVNHAPSPQQCALAGGVWDDSLLSDPANFGGACLSKERADQKVQKSEGQLEVVELESASYDPEAFGYDEALETRGTPGRLPLRCIRHADRAVWYQAHVFGRVCTAPMDWPHLPEDLPPHAWDSWIPEGGLQDS